MTAKESFVCAECGDTYQTPVGRRIVLCPMCAYGLPNPWSRRTTEAAVQAGAEAVAVADEEWRAWWNSEERYEDRSPNRIEVFIAGCTRGFIRGRAAAQAEGALPREVVLAVEDFIAAVESASQYKEAVYDGFYAARKNETLVIHAHTGSARVARKLLALEAILVNDSARGAMLSIPPEVAARLLYFLDRYRESMPGDPDMETTESWLRNAAHAALGRGAEGRG